MQSAVYTKTEKSTIGEDTPLVLLNLCLPQVRTEDKSPFTKAFGAYYKALSTGFMQFCTKRQHPQEEKSQAPSSLLFNFAGTVAVKRQQESVCVF